MENKPAGIKSLLALVPFVSPWLAVGASLSLAAAAGAALVIPVAARRVIDEGFSTTDLSHNLSSEAPFVLLLVVAALLAVTSALRFFFVSWLSETLADTLKHTLHRHFLSLTPASLHSGNVLARLSKDTAIIRAVFSASAPLALRNAILFLGAAAMMILTSPQLSTMLLLLFPIVAVPLGLFGWRVRKLTKGAEEANLKADVLATEQLRSLRIVQAFGQEHREHQSFRKTLQTARAAARIRLIARAILIAFIVFVIISGIALLMRSGAQHVTSNTLSGGAFVQFLLYAAFATAALSAFNETWHELHRAARATHRLTQLLQLRLPLKQPLKPQNLPTHNFDLHIQNVTFTYPDREHPALQDVSIHIHPGETVALVGPSGAGKSTVFHLLQRFADPQKGRLLLGNVDLRHADLSQVRRRFALVPQDILLFGISVADNIRYGQPDASPAQVEEAARCAAAHEFITQLPQAYDTCLAEAGHNLSAGQRQRLAIARAFLYDAPVLLLDEATSALDPENETLVQKALKRLMQHRTTLVIAHRNTTIQNAHRLLLMESGRLLATGTHKDLMHESTLYQKLLQPLSDQSA